MCVYEPFLILNSCVVLSVEYLIVTYLDILSSKTSYLYKISVYGEFYIDKENTTRQEDNQTFICQFIGLVQMGNTGMEERCEKKGKKHFLH